MTQNTRNFCGSISVKFDGKRTKLELSPAEDHGGPCGMLRVRQCRRWLDGFFNADGITALITSLASTATPQEATPPDIPLHTYVSVPIPSNTWNRCITRTSTPAPVRLYDGRFYVLVHIFEHGYQFVPCTEVKILSPNAARRALFARVRKQQEEV